MEKIKEKLTDELTRQLQEIAKRIIDANAENWECAGELAPEWVGKVFGATKDLLNTEKVMEAAEVIAALLETAKSAPIDVRLCIVSTALALFADKRQTGLPTSPPWEYGIG